MLSVRLDIKMKRPVLTVESLVLHHRISILKNWIGNDMALAWLCHYASLTSYPVVSLTIMLRFLNMLANSKKYYLELVVRVLVKVERRTVRMTIECHQTDHGLSPYHQHR